MPCIDRSKQSIETNVWLTMHGSRLTEARHQAFGLSSDALPGGYADVSVYVR